MAKIKTLDTTSHSIKKEYLEPTAKKLAKSYHAGETLKLAFIRFAADSMELAGEDRAAFIRQMDSTPGWWGCGNNSACRQHFENTKGGTAEIAKDYAGW
jgi:hypothetical protein